jgi:hypothetical protein
MSTVDLSYPICCPAICGSVSDVSFIEVMTWFAHVACRSLVSGRAICKQCLWASAFWNGLRRTLHPDYCLFVFDVFVHERGLCHVVAVSILTGGGGVCGGSIGIPHPQSLRGASIAQSVEWLRYRLDDRRVAEGNILLSSIVFGLLVPSHPVGTGGALP